MVTRIFVLSCSFRIAQFRLFGYWPVRKFDEDDEDGDTNIYVHFKFLK